MLTVAQPSIKIQDQIKSYLKRLWLFLCEKLEITNYG